MNGFSRSLLATVLMVSTGLAVFGQPRLVAPSRPASYTVGDEVDPGTFVLDKDRAPRLLSELVQPDSKVVVLMIFGGAAPTAPDYHPLRAGLWCPDSFDELPLQRALVRQFKGEPVQFVAVAVPPAYSDVYGFPRDIFTTLADDDPEYVAAVNTFIALTEATKDTDVMPFRELFYDPKYRLAQDRGRQVGPGYGEVHAWQGKFRWRGDLRKYATPMIWILDNRLRIVREPFFGNTYNDDPPDIRYEFRDVKSAIEELLGDQ